MKTPWRVTSTNFGESMGYDSMSRIVDADGQLVAQIGDGTALAKAEHEAIAALIVRRVNFGSVMPLTCFPWMIAPLDAWSIVGMNHYHVGSERHLFVSMEKYGRCIKEEGLDDQFLWNRLLLKAMGETR